MYFINVKILCTEIFQHKYYHVFSTDIPGTVFAFIVIILSVLLQTIQSTGSSWYQEYLFILHQLVFGYFYLVLAVKHHSCLFQCYFVSLLCLTYPGEIISSENQCGNTDECPQFKFRSMSFM